MRYIFAININTDGDFYFPFVPCGMECDGSYRYNFDKNYKDREAAIEDIINICIFLKEHIISSREYVKEMWHECIDNFVKHLKESEESPDEMVTEFIGGNYDGTEFCFYAKPQRVNCSFNVSDEELEMIHRNSNDVTNQMIKDTVLALFKDNE